jgi:leucyl aminopeptidase (aminopeptidase T)
MKQAYDIDYELVQANCRREAKRLSQGSRAVLRTGADCVLQFDLTGRDWHIDAGDGDLPCGEIYIAPVESTTSGSVFFETFYLEDVKYCDVILQVANGEVCGSSHEQIARHFAQLPRENRIVGELGLGMNPNVVDLCGYSLLDEKMAGTFHIAVGANYMFGGTNQANDHIDFVGRGELEMMESWNRK